MKPKVTVLCMTYNQAEYIKDALDGFVMQKTNFPFQVLVHDDASTDNTPEIIRQYADRYPDIIIPILSNENHFQMGRSVIAEEFIPRINSEYVAICDGDDYWSDPTKLQRQVDFLDSHPKHTLVFHPVQGFFEDDSNSRYLFPARVSNLCLEKLLRTNFIPNCSVMYRWCRPGPELVHVDAYPVDWYIHMLHAVRGRIGFIPRIMAQYRRHSCGVSYQETVSEDSLHLKYGIKELKFFMNVEREIAPNPGQYHKFVQERARLYMGIYARYNKFDAAMQILQMCPDALYQDIDAIRRFDKKYQHRFNQLLMVVILGLLILTIGFCL